MVLERALQLRDALAPLCVMTQFNASASRGLRLKRFVLSDEEWTFLEQLHSLLEVCSNVRIIEMYGSLNFISDSPF